MTPAEARLALTARIAALVPDASYQQGSEVWTESRVPLVPENDFATNRVLGDWIAVEMRFRVFFPSAAV